MSFQKMSGTAEEMAEKRFEAIPSDGVSALRNISKRLGYSICLREEVEPRDKLIEVLAEALRMLDSKLQETVLYDRLPELSQDVDAALDQAREHGYIK